MRIFVRKLVDCPSCLGTGVESRGPCIGLDCATCGGDCLVEEADADFRKRITDALYEAEPMSKRAIQSRRTEALLLGLIPPTARVGDRVPTLPSEWFYGDVSITRMHDEFLWSFPGHEKTTEADHHRKMLDGRDDASG